jgi:flagellar hook-associated protein FlgK
MKEIEKLNFRLHDAANYVGDHELAGAINHLIDKVNELTQKVNELNYEISVIHEWKLQKEGI